MSATIAIRDTQGLIDGAIFGAAAILLLSVLAWLDHRQRAADRNNPVPVPDDLPVLDHAKCAHEGCTRTLCFCRTLHPRTGQPVTCVGADKPACDHSLVSRATTGGHCMTHQRSCVDCQLEDTAMFGTQS